MYDRAIASKHATHKTGHCSEMANWRTGGSKRLELLSHLLLLRETYVLLLLFAPKAVTHDRWPFAPAWGHCLHDTQS